MAEEEAHDNVTTKKRTISGDDDLQSLIKAAVLSRLSHFKEQADSLTLEGVRRLLENDLGLKINALETHKRFVRQTLDQALDIGTDDNSSKTPSEEEKVEDSPVMGLLADKKTEKEKSKELQVYDNEEVPSESMIKKAIRERIPYVKANSEKVTMAGFRRLLKEDLELEKFALDSYKKLISTELDEALNETANEVKKKTIKNSSKRERSPESSGSLESDNNEENEEEELKPKKKPITKGRMQKLKGATKRRKTEMDAKESGKKRIVSQDNSDAENSKSSGDSHSSAEKPTKKKEVSAPAYGKRVEQLKSVIKLCGMSVPPVIYKKVKQVPENRREAQLISELEGILAREGLSSNPSEKEIKELRRRKARAKELEGIDMKNIVSSSRRRSTSAFFPPKPPPVVTAGDNSEDDTSGEDDENNSDSDDEDNDDDEDHVEDEENAGDDAEVKEEEEEEEEEGEDESG